MPYRMYDGLRSERKDGKKKTLFMHKYALEPSRNVYQRFVISQCQMTSFQDLEIAKMEQEELPKKIFQPPVTAIGNAKGRPTKQNMITFSPQPKSMVSKLLRKIKADECKHSITVDVNEALKDSEVIQIVQENDEALGQDEDFTCKFCPHRSEDAKEHRIHLKNHKQFTCNYPDCSYSCKLSSNLTKHKRIHTGEKPYLCDQCSFRSSFVNSLKVHKRIHTSERPYQCKQCSYRCNSSWNLKKHCFYRHSEAQSTA